jgi:hypothetical protein
MAVTPKGSPYHDISHETKERFRALDLFWFRKSGIMKIS